jgi:chemotaxis protein MotB
MARKAAWEDLADSDLGPYAQPRGTRWRRVFTDLSIVAVATFVAAYYVPLYRSQQRLSDEYRALSDQSRAQSESIEAARAQLKSITAERDQLRTDHDRKVDADKDASSQRERARAAVSSKLDKPMKKGTVAVIATEGNLVVALDSGLLFLPQRLDLTPTAPALLCEILKAADAKSLSVNGVLPQGMPVPAALAKGFPSPWALSAARAAAVAESVANKCGLPAAQVTAAGSADHDPFNAALATSKLTGEHVELVIDAQR